MSTTITQYPDSLSLSGNLKKFEITADAEIAFVLQQGATVILSEKYQPDTNDLVTVDVKAVIERLLEIVVPTTSVVVTEQTLAALDFTVTVDALTPIAFKVIKGGVAEMTEITASEWIEAHFLTWQPQEKLILQEAPEWLGIYPLAAGAIQVKAYFSDGTDYTGSYAILEAAKLYSINTSWGEISEWLTSLSEGSGSGSGVGAILGDRPIAWDVWFEVGGVRMTPIQRYQLRNAGDEEHLFVWVNTVGSIDSMSFTGYNEEDEKLEHQNALYEDETIGEYDIEKAREVRQSTGYLDSDESLWLKDFFYSRKKYMVRADGSLKQVAVVGSKIISVSADDEFDYEFTYRYGEDGQLLNSERTHTELPAPEGLADFFLTELLSQLTEASYQDNLLMAVQSPYAIGWQKLSMSQLWGGALPGLVDGTTIVFRNGKLTAITEGEDTGGGGTDQEDSRTELISGTIVWRSGLTYQSTIIEYKILGQRYTAQAKLITLAASDPNLDRIDMFYVDAFGNLAVKTGTPASNPTTPILTSRELEVMTVYIQAGALEPSNVEIEKIYDEHAVDEWSPSEVHDADISVDFDSTEDPFNGAKRIKVLINTAIPTNEHYLGERYRGGIIFYIDPASGGKRGLISAENDTAIGVFYESLSGGGPYVTGASGIVIGTGQDNSAHLLANARSKDHAVKYCDDLIIDGYNDFFLPSEGEMMAMYINRFKIGNFANKEYWTSTEVTGGYDWNKARTFGFAEGTAYTNFKNTRFNVRAIRAFDDDNDEPEDSPESYYPTSNTKMTWVSAVPVPVKEGILSLYIKSTLPWRANSMLLIEAYLADEQVGYVAMSVTNMFNYKHADDTWQMIAIQMYQFAPSQTTVDGFRISLIGSWPNLIDLGFDDIRFQYTNIETTDALKIVYDHTEFNFTELPDGARVEFTTAKPFINGTTRLHLNGVRQILGTDKHYLEVLGKIVFDFPPESKCKFVIDYKSLAP